MKMPNITIKTSEVYHNTGSYNSNGKAVKFLVEQLLSLDPNLSIAEVLTDTDEIYSVRLKIMGSNLGVHIFNDYTYLRLRMGAWDSSGTFIYSTGLEGVSYSDFLGYYYSYSDPAEDWYPYLNVSVVGVDGALKYVVFQSSRKTTAPYFCYGMFTADTLPTPIYVGWHPIESRGLSYTWPSRPQIPVGTTLPAYFYNPATDAMEAVSFFSLTDKTPATRAGYKYSLMPKAYHAYSTNMGAVNVKWGGLYDLYLLYDDNGAVSTLCGESVTINGQKLLSAGDVCVIG